MHSYCSLFVRYTAVVLLLCSGMQLHAAARPTVGLSGKMTKMQIPLGCRLDITELKEDMVLLCGVIKGMFKELAQVPGLKPSNLADLIPAEEFVIRLRSLQQIDSPSCYMIFQKYKVDFDRTFTQVLGNTGNADAAWQHVDDLLEEKILELSNQGIHTLARLCAKPSTNPTYMDGSLLLSAHQLQSGPVAQIEHVDK
jgi:hypothetical protein